MQTFVVLPIQLELCVFECFFTMIYSCFIFVFYFLLNPQFSNYTQRGYNGNVSNSYEKVNSNGSSTSSNNSNYNSSRSTTTGATKENTAISWNSNSNSTKSEFDSILDDHSELAFKHKNDNTISTTSNYVSGDITVPHVLL